MSRIKKILIYTGIVIILMVTALIAYDINDDFEQSIGYSSYNIKDNGGKALYLLTEEMGFDVRRYTRPSRFLPDNATVVAFEPVWDIFNQQMEKKYLKKWIEEGNALVLIGGLSPDESMEYIEELTDSRPSDLGQYEDAFVYSVGAGKVIYIENELNYTNSGLKALDPGVQFIDALNEASHKTVLFNEYFHGIGDRNTNLWDILGSGGKLIVIQLFLCLLIFLFIVSRRFGKPVVVFENIKRKENENLFALSNIYYKAKANDMALEIYLNSLKKELAKFLGFGLDDWSDKDLINAANSNNILKGLDVGGVFEESERYAGNRKSDNKKLLDLFKRLELIRKGIK